MASKSTRLNKINKVDVTSDTLSDRAGLAAMANFISGTKLPKALATVLKDLRKSNKGIRLHEVFLQILSFFCEGDSSHLSAFDEMRGDSSRNSLLNVKQLLGTAQLKRLLTKIEPKHLNVLRPFIQEVTLTAMKENNPSVITLFLDSTAYNNDDAKCRGGCKLTYKKFKGYHPLNLVWDGMLLDTLFRSGEKHSNHGTHALDMIRDSVSNIRRVIGEDTPIIILMDSGFYDQKVFDLCDDIGVGFVSSAKMYSDLKKVKATNSIDMQRYSNKDCVWAYCEFVDKRETWDKGYYGLYLRALEKDGEPLLGLDDRTIVTNLGEYNNVGRLLIEVGHGHLLQAQEIIKMDHSRGGGELTFRSIKEFSDEKMPCLDYCANAIWYYLSTLAFNLFQAFKRKVASHLFVHNCYPNTVRRKLFDIAGKIVRSGKQITLKITSYNMQRLDFSEIWRKSLIPWDVIPS